MIVVDASAMVELLLVRPLGLVVRGHLLSDDEGAMAPHLLDAEVGQVLRRFTLRAELTPQGAFAALRRLAVLPLIRVEHGPLVHRAFELRNNVTMYDALYLALAERFDAAVLTTDRRLVGVPGCSARVEALSAS